MSIDIFATTKKKSSQVWGHGFRYEVYLIDLAKGDLLDALMLDNLAQDTAVASTNDQDLAGVRVGVHRDVSHHLLVTKGRGAKLSQNVR